MAGVKEPPNQGWRVHAGGEVLVEDAEADDVLEEEEEAGDGGEEADGEAEDVERGS